MRWLEEFIRETPSVSTDKTDKSTSNDDRRTKDKSFSPKTGHPPTDTTDKTPFETAIESWERIQERAAILEYDGGLTRNKADCEAFMEWFRTFVQPEEDRNR